MNKSAVLKELNEMIEKEKEILEILREYSNVSNITGITIGIIDGLGLAVEKIEKLDD